MSAVTTRLSDKNRLSTVDQEVVDRVRIALMNMRTTLTNARIEEEILRANVLREFANNGHSTGKAEVLTWVHPPNHSCFRRGCVIHWPTDPHQDWPTTWSFGRMRRTCPHGVLHPDKNDVRYHVSREKRFTAQVSVLRAELRHICCTEPGCRCWLAELRG